MRSGIMLVAVAAGVCMVPGETLGQRRCRPSEVQISPPDAQIPVGQQTPFLPTAYDTSGNPCAEATFTWTTNNPRVATVDSNGIATAVSPGVAIITATTGTGASATSGRATILAMAGGPVPRAEATPVPPPVPSEPQPAAPAAPPADPRAEIQQLVAAYARAIESRSVAEIRRVYPGLTGSQQQGWEQFFQSVRSLRARLAITRLDASGTMAELAVSGSYEYDAGGGRTERQPVSFSATVSLEGDTWRLRTIR